MFEPKRLHLIFIVLNAGKNIKKYVYSFIAIFIAGSNDSFGKLVLLIGVGAIGIFIIVTSILSWVRYTYRIEENELRIEYGVFVQKKRYIPFERIQSIDISEGILQRMFGLVKVQIETAGGGGGADEAEAVLAAISKAEAQILQECVTSAKKPEAGQPKMTQENQRVYKITTSELLLLSITSGGVGVVISAVIALLSQLGDYIPYERWFGGIEHWAARNIVAIAILIFCGFLLAWIIALIGTLLKYANFTVTKTDEDLIIFHGLLERRQVTIPLNRIQAIRISENIIRQMLGYATVYVESAGGSFGNKLGSKMTLLPMAKLQDIAAIIEPNLTEYKIPTDFHPVPKRSLSRYMVRSTFWIIPIVIVSLIFLKIWGLLSLILLVIAIPWAFLKYKAAGWNLSGSQLSLRSRGVNQTTIIMKKNKIQSLKIHESYFQQKKELATILAFAKSGIGPVIGQVNDVEKDDMQKIYSWYAK